VARHTSEVKTTREIIRCQFARQSDDSLHLVAELDGQVIGWLRARMEPPVPNAAAQLTREHGWTGLRWRP